MEQSGDVRQFRKSITIYHSFPSLTAVAASLGAVPYALSRNVSA